MKKTHLQFESETIEVEELLKENFGFILYRGVENGRHYLTVVRNHSFAYWDETVSLTGEETQTFKENPGYSQALILLNAKKSGK